MKLLLLILFFFCRAQSAESQLAEQIVSIFENGTPVIQYNYVARLEDWKKRGLTFGRAGFTSCQDGVEVLQELKKINPKNALITFLSEMQKAAEGSVSCEISVNKLITQKFDKSFSELADLPEVKLAQDRVFQRRYYEPAQRLTKKYRLKNYWSFVVILDSYIQHGEGDQGEGIEAILKKLKRTKPRTAKQEFKWLNGFLDQRFKILSHGDDEWKHSVGRVNVLRDLLRQYFKKTPDIVKFRSSEYGNFDLNEAK